MFKCAGKYNHYQALTSLDPPKACGPHGVAPLSLRAVLPC